MNRWSYLLIVAGAVLWGLIGVFVAALRANGFTALQIVALRVITAGAILLLYALVTNRSLLRIKLKDVWYFIGTGILSIVFFNWCYFTAMQETSLSVAVVLLYTAPAFVTLISRFVFKELFTKRKLLSLLTMIIGCAFVVGFLPKPNLSISLFGLVVGLGSGFGYALYSIFGKLASKKYKPLTIATYTFLFASLLMIPVSGLWEVKEIILKKEILALSFGLGLFPTSLAYLLYTAGLSRVETGNASIIANIEPVVAMIVGVTVFNETLVIWQIIGSILILSAAILVQKAESRNTSVKST